jgi:hypothetical protein
VSHISNAGFSGQIQFVHIRQTEISDVKISATSRVNGKIERKTSAFHKPLETPEMGSGA